MNVSLTDELEAFIQGKVSTGLFQNASEVVRDALRKMKEKDEDRDQQMVWLKAALDQGWTEAQAGKLTGSKEVKARMAQFKELHKSRSRKA
jgi:antitoxin ParD1/3/4